MIRGWIGAEYADVNSLQNTGMTHGVAVIEHLRRQSGRAELACKPGDILSTLDGDPIANQLELRNKEAALAPGTKRQTGRHAQRQGFQPVGNARGASAASGGELVSSSAARPPRLFVQAR